MFMRADPNRPVSLRILCTNVASPSTAVGHLHAGCIRKNTVGVLCGRNTPSYTGTVLLRDFSVLNLIKLVDVTYRQWISLRELEER